MCKSKVIYRNRRIRLTPYKLSVVFCLLPPVLGSLLLGFAASLPLRCLLHACDFDLSVVGETRRSGDQQRRRRESPALRRALKKQRKLLRKGRHVPDVAPIVDALLGTAALLASVVSRLPSFYVKPFLLLITPLFLVLHPLHRCIGFFVCVRFRVLRAGPPLRRWLGSFLLVVVVRTRVMLTF
jgi:hypothetical protein